ncbi:MAG TPA: vWA domain-containing protein [Gemmata sp.]
MRTPSHATRAAFRRAACASVVLHAGAAAVLFVLVRPDEVKTREPSIDPRAPHVQMCLVETVAEIEIRAEPPAPAPTNTSAPQTPQPPQPEPPGTAPPAARGPFVAPRPRTLPPEVLAVLHKPGAPLAPVTPTDPNVQPAGHSGAPKGPSAGSAMHGALKPEQTVVYVLDASGSMGAGGKFDVARAALAATLAQQPRTVRFQVVVYDGAARPLVPGGARPATSENTGAVMAKLAAVAPRGKSNHLVALRAALDLRPDVVVWLTDADDLTAAVLRPVLKSAARPVSVCVGLVTAAGVQQPRELK